jgi:hypothetical protein|tara:strand:+ start:511 stop:717 length:207 start_codon:yes stop_codon:yes gene_type:complete
MENFKEYLSEAKGTKEDAHGQLVVLGKYIIEELKKINPAGLDYDGTSIYDVIKDHAKATVKYEKKWMK